MAKKVFSPAHERWRLSTLPKLDLVSGRPLSKACFYAGFRDFPQTREAIRQSLEYYAEEYEEAKESGKEAFYDSGFSKIPAIPWTRLSDGSLKMLNIWKSEICSFGRNPKIWATGKTFGFRSFEDFEGTVFYQKVWEGSGGQWAIDRKKIHSFVENEIVGQKKISDEQILKYVELELDNPPYDRDEDDAYGLEDTAKTNYSETHFEVYNNVYNLIKNLMEAHVAQFGFSGKFVLRKPTDAEYAALEKTTIVFCDTPILVDTAVRYARGDSYLNNADILKYTLTIFDENNNKKTIPAQFFYPCSAKIARDEVPDTLTGWGSSVEKPVDHSQKSIAKMRKLLDAMGDL